MSKQGANPPLHTVTNTILLEGLRDAGNKTIWRSFVERYRPLIVRYAMRAGLVEADAQDAAQHSLIAFCVSYQEGKYQRDQGRLRHWLFGIARNQIRNTIRKKPRREIQMTSEADQTDFFEQVSGKDDGEALWEQEWRDAVLRQCLAEVGGEFDAKSLEAFDLFACRGLTAKEVGERLNMTPNAVFIAKHRIMKRLRELVPRMEEVW